MIRFACSVIALLVVIGLAAAPAGAEQGATEPPRAEPQGQQSLAAETKAVIGIRVIYAVKDKTRSIDPALEDIQNELNELPTSKFRLLDRLETKVAIKSSVELQLPGDRAVAVSFQGLDESKGKKMLSLELAMAPAFKIQLKVADGGRYLLAGPSHLEGMLILDVSAKLKEPTK